MLNNPAQNLHRCPMFCCLSAEVLKTDPRSVGGRSGRDVSNKNNHTSKRVQPPGPTDGFFNYNMNLGAPQPPTQPVWMLNPSTRTLFFWDLLGSFCPDRVNIGTIFLCRASCSLRSSAPGGHLTQSNLSNLQQQICFERGDRKYLTDFGRLRGLW